MATVAMNSASSPITQVSQVPTQTTTNLQPQLLTRLLLELRGERFSVDRETIMNLPESVLLCLFPNGLVLSRQSVALSDGQEPEEDEEVYGVDVSPFCVFDWVGYPLEITLPGVPTEDRNILVAHCPRFHFFVM